MLLQFAWIGRLLSRWPTKLRRRRPTEVVGVPRDILEVRESILNIIPIPEVEHRVRTSTELMVEGVQWVAPEDAGRWWVFLSKQLEENLQPYQQEVWCGTARQVFEGELDYRAYLQ
jgi:phage pi2 protein 07